MVEITNPNPSKTQILEGLENVLREYENIRVRLRRDKAIKSRVMYGAIRDEIESSLMHVKRQIHWVATERGEEEI